MARRRRARLGSDLTATDQFCGAGGTSLGARRALVHVRVAINHNPLAVQVHAMNHPETEHDCADLSKCHPSRYVRTDILLSSPSCTFHSTAAGARRKKERQLALSFEDSAIQAEDIGDRSRATMWSVVEAAEYHGYEGLVVENVPDVARWMGFRSWLSALRSFGYKSRLISQNSMFALNTPQSRNRLYMVFWRDGVPTPNLDFRPRAHCPKCDHDTAAIQTWKGAGGTAGIKGVGEYRFYSRRRQYTYSCTQCGTEVLPYHTASAIAIDSSLPAPTLGERAAAGEPVAESIRIRLGKGLERWGFAPMLVTTNCTTHNGRIRSLYEPAFTMTCSNTTAVALPPEREPFAGMPDWANDYRHPSSETPEAVEAWLQRLRAGSLAMTSMDEFRYRTLSVQERLVIMGFNRDYRMAGTTEEQHMLVGNANPPEVCKMLVERVAAALAPEMYPEDIRPKRAA